MYEAQGISPYSGEHPRDHALLRMILSLCHKLPAMDSEKFNLSYQNEYHDTLLISYLGVFLGFHPCFYVFYVIYSILCIGKGITYFTNNCVSVPRCMTGVGQFDSSSFSIRAQAMVFCSLYPRAVASRR